MLRIKRQGKSFVYENYLIADSGFSFCLTMCSFNTKCTPMVVHASKIDLKRHRQGIDLPIVASP